MSVPAAAVATLVVLAAAGCLPTLALIGLRWSALPLAPLAGALLGAVAATAELALGGTFVVWFAALGAVGVVGSLGWWWRRPDARPSARGHLQVPRLAAGVGALGVVAALAWCLRSLADPTVGFDARSVWLMRAGWLLQGHHQLLVDMRGETLHLPQTSYPPLVSALGALSWSVSGGHSVRLEVVVIALVNACALAAAALALVECGHLVAQRMQLATPRHQRSGYRWEQAPVWVGAAAGVLVVLVTFGVTEPFMTNGYADPLWSIAMVGALAWGLQLGESRQHRGSAAVLVLVAGMSKEEGAATAVVMIALLVARRLWAARAGGPGARRWHPLVAGMLGLVLVGLWPATIRLVHARRVVAGGPRVGSYLLRAHQSVVGLAPHLDVVLLAGALSLAGGLVLAAVRRKAGIGNDGWGWAALGAGLVVLLGAYVTGTGAVPLWLMTTASRVTEYPQLVAWWIVATWAVTASAAPAFWRLTALGAPARPDRRVALSSPG